MRTAKRTIITEAAQGVPAVKVFRYNVTGTLHGSEVYAPSEGAARRAFHKHYNGESIIHLKRY